MFDDSDHRLAATALLVHVADADGHFDEDERERMKRIVSDRFDLDASEATRLIGEALQSDHEAVGIDYFVNVLNRTLDEDGKLRIVDMMWDIVFADGKATETEDTIIWRIAGMLDVPPEARETLRRSRDPAHWPDKGR